MEGSQESQPALQDIKVQEATSERVPAFEYYKILVELRTELDESYWTAVNFFILVQGILIAGVFGFLADTSKLEPYWLLPIEAGGLIFAVMWLFVSSRRMAALRLAEEQGRAIEAIIRINNKQKPNEPFRFPLFFYGSKSIFHKHDTNLAGNLGEMKEEIRSRYLPGVSGNRVSIWVSLRFSSINILSFWVPLMFIGIWSVTILLTLPWLIYGSIDLPLGNGFLLFLIVEIIIAIAIFIGIFIISGIWVRKNIPGWKGWLEKRK